MEKTMKAARLYELGKPLVIEEVPIPELSDDDVLVEVKATFVAPSMNDILNPGGNFIRPALPAIFGSDAVGIISKLGSKVRGLQEGQKVWVNSLLYHKTDEYALMGREGLSDSMAFQGMFTFNPNNVHLLDEYQGSFAQYVKAPSTNVAILPDNFPLEQAVRIGYLGTAYQALKYANVHYGSTVLINGSTGTVGTSAVLLSLAMGATKIIAVANKKERLEKIRQINPLVISTLSLLDGDVTGRIRELTNGKGAESFVDCLQYVDTQSTHQCLYAVKKGGTAVFVGGATGNINIPYGFLLGTEIKLTGSLWFHHFEANEMVNLAQSGLLNLNLFDVKTFSLDEINEAVALAGSRLGGLTTVMVKI
ncbi:MAG: zinc-binding dehydrogenase [Bacteroidetes bacterium]|nr:zinc-binding dehydrogenase [Bacteroidota bacterium]